MIQTRHKTIIYNLHGGICFYCKQPIALEHATLDHVIPKAKGGKNKLSNYVLSCKPCNHEKGCKILENVEEIIALCEEKVKSIREEHYPKKKKGRPLIFMTPYQKAKLKTTARDLEVIESILKSLRSW